MAPSNSLLPCLSALVILFSPLALAQVQEFNFKTQKQDYFQDDLNCDIQGWLAPDYVPPENPHCVEFDGSLVPDCGKYLVNNVTSYYHIHEYSKFLSSLQNFRPKTPLNLFRL